MPKKIKKIKIRKSKKNKNLILYVENSIPKCKIFQNGKSLKTFINEFNFKYPREKFLNRGYFVEFIITDIKGKITDFDNILSN